MDAKPSKATPTASQVWWLSRALGAAPFALYVPTYFSKQRMRSLQACFRRGWLHCYTKREDGFFDVRITGAGMAALKRHAIAAIQL